MRYIMGKTSKIAALQLALFGLFVLANAGPIVAGPAWVLEVDLDAAARVFVGQIVSIEADGNDSQTRPSEVHYGRATIAVKEVLKGEPAEFVAARVITRVDLYPEPGPASPPQIRRVGDVGIWLIGTAHGNQLLPERQKADIVKILNALNKKNWSQPVNGLRAWAVLVDQDLGGIIVAVNNVSKADVFMPLPGGAKVPAEPGKGICTVAATGEDGKTVELGLGAEYSRDKAIPCEKLLPGKTRYLHLDYRFGPGWRQKLLPGKYSVVVTYKNEREDGYLLSSPSEQVKPWNGELKTLPVEFVLTPDEAKWNSF